MNKNKKNKSIEKFLKENKRTKIVIEWKTAKDLGDDYFINLRRNLRRKFDDMKLDFD